MNHMNSLIFQTASRALMPLLLLFSVVILMRGHNEPGGGFIGGLVAAASVAMYSMAFGSEAARSLLRGVSLTTIIGIGLLMAVGSAIIAMLLNGTFMQGWWNTDAEGHGWMVPGLGEVKFGTVVLFDIGVYVVVFGVVLLMIFELEESKV